MCAVYGQDASRSSNYARCLLDKTVSIILTRLVIVADNETGLKLRTISGDPKRKSGDSTAIQKVS